MRPIKFRAWDKEDEVMRSWEEIDIEKGAGDDYWLIGYQATRLTTRYDHAQIIMQYTGLKDGFGTEIFEGDILTDGKTQVGQVIYLPQEAGWVVKTRNSDYRLGHRNTGESYLMASNHGIIGNIYENPELIEEQNK